MSLRTLKFMTGFSYWLSGATFMIAVAHAVREQWLLCLLFAGLMVATAASAHVYMMLLHNKYHELVVQMIVELFEESGDTDETAES